jgi:lysozyme family protein
VRLPYNEFIGQLTGDMIDATEVYYEDDYQIHNYRGLGCLRFLRANENAEAETCPTTYGGMVVIEEINYTIQLEGGDTTTDHPSDYGGVTKYGISQKYHPDVDVKNLTQTEAVALYIEEYWNPMRCSEILSKRVRWKAFDTAVMFGVKRTAIMLQDIVGVDQDGRMGLVTLNAINQMPEDTVLTQIAFAQIRSRASAVVRDSSQTAFLMGWLSRAQDLGYAVEKKL